MSEERCSFSDQSSKRAKSKGKLSSVTQAQSVVLLWGILWGKCRTKMDERK